MQRFIQTISEDLLDEIQLIKMHISILMKNMPERSLFYRMGVLNMKHIHKLQFVIRKTTIYSSLLFKNISWHMFGTADFEANNTVHTFHTTCSRSHFYMQKHTQLLNWPLFISQWSLFLNSSEPNLLTSQVSLSSLDSEFAPVFLFLMQVISLRSFWILNKY
jgi:hypothetical protein